MPVHPDMIHPTVSQSLRVFEGADIAAWTVPTSSSSPSMGLNFATMCNLQPAEMQPKPQQQQSNQEQPMPMQQTEPKVPPHVHVPPHLPGSGPDIFYDLFGAQAFPLECANNQRLCDVFWRLRIGPLIICG